MNNFKNHHRRNRFKSNGDRNYRKRNGNGGKIHGEFNSNLEFKRKYSGRTNHNPFKLVEKYNDFSFSKFCQFIHGNNIVKIFNLLNKTIYYINRNGNTKILLMDLSIEISICINNIKES